MRGFRVVRFLKFWPRLRGQATLPPDIGGHGPDPGANMQVTLTGIVKDTKVNKPGYHFPNVVNVLPTCSITGRIVFTFCYNTLSRLALFLVVTSAPDCKGFYSGRLIVRWLLFMMTTSHPSMVLYVCLLIYQSCRNTFASQTPETLGPDGMIEYLGSATPEIQQNPYGIYWSP